MTEISKPENVALLTEENARKGTQLSSIKNNLDEKRAVATVSLIVQKLNDSVKVGNKMDKFDIVECAATLVREYWYVKLEQLLHFSKMVRQGRLGTFPRFGQPEFFDLFGKYLLRQDDKRAEEYQANKEQPSDIRQADKNAKKLGTLLTKEDLEEMDRAKNTDQPDQIY